MPVLLVTNAYPDLKILIIRQSAHFRSENVKNSHDYHFLCFATMPQATFDHFQTKKGTKISRGLEARNSEFRK